MTELVLHRALACPYSHRVELVLAAKGQRARFVEIDLLNREPDFVARSSGGKVPLLEIDGTEVPFGDRVNEFLDERFPDPPLNAGDAHARSRARTWVDWCTSTLGPTYEAALMNVEADRESELFERLEVVVNQLEARLRGVELGPYFHGSSPGWVDLTYATIALRFEGLRRFHDWSIPGACPLVAAWFATLTSDPIVREHSDCDGILEKIAYYRALFIQARSNG